MSRCRRVQKTREAVECDVSASGTVNATSGEGTRGDFEERPTDRSTVPT